MQYNLKSHLVFHTVLFFTLISQIAFSAENDNPPIKQYATLKILGEDILLFNYMFHRADYMTTSVIGGYFDRQNMSLWDLRYKHGETILQKYSYSLLLQNREEYPLPDVNLERSIKDSPDSPYPAQSSIRYRRLAISPNEKYALYWTNPESPDLYEIKTGRNLSKGFEDEIVLGFDSQSNIYCGRLMSPPEFVLRDPETMQILKTFRKTSDDINETDSNITRNSAEQDLFYGICPLPVESPDGKYVVMMFYQHRPLDVIKEKYRGDSRLLKEWVEVDDYSPKLHLIGTAHVYDRETGLSVYESPIRISSSRLLPVISEDGKKIIYPDAATQGVWVYNFEKKMSRSLLIPLPKKQDDRRSWKEYLELRGFTFTPDNQILVWLYSPTNMLHIANDSKTYLFDPETGSHQAMTAFVSPTEAMSADVSPSRENMKITWQFFFSPDHRTVITFQTTLGRDIRPCGKYVFWDYRTKEILYETPDRYKPGFILTPDWKTMILATTEIIDFDPEKPWKLRDFQYQMPDVEIYDISSIINRP